MRTTTPNQRTIIPPVARLKRLLEWRQIMPEPSQVTVRLLPDESALSATVRTRSGAEIELDPVAESIKFEQGALVELESPDMLCLGKVVLREETRIVVAVEHTVDLHKLARIQEVWDAPKA